MPKHLRLPFVSWCTGFPRNGITKVSKCPDQGQRQNEWLQSALKDPDLRSWAEGSIKLEDLIRGPQLHM